MMGALLGLVMRTEVVMFAQTLGVDLLVVMVFLLLMVHRHMDGDLDRVRHWLLDLIGDVLLNFDRNWTLNRDLHGVWDVLLDRDRDVLLNRVGLWDWDLHRHWHWFVDMHWDGTIVRDMHWVWDLLDDLIRHWFLHRDWHWLLDMDRHWAIDWNMDWVVDDLLNRRLFLVGLEVWHLMVFLVSTEATGPAVQSTLVLFLVIERLSFGCLAVIYFGLRHWFLFIFGRCEKHQG
uniref:Uncharacterized protein n=1 Tax=Anopheles culicifacies TaxID=139723 RepID=A0A182MQ87_9DIPT